MSKEKNKPTVLIAEDDEINYTLIELMLKDYDLEILHSVTGKQTVEFCKQNDDIDLILMDIRMPEMNGDEAALKIKEFKKNLPMIAQSAYLYNEIIQYGNIFDDYITKPIDKNLLLNKINKFINITN